MKNKDVSKPLLYFSHCSLICTTSTSHSLFLYTYQVQAKTKLSLHYSSLTTRWQRPKVFSTCHKIWCWGGGHWPVSAIQNRIKQGQSQEQSCLKTAKGWLISKVETQPSCVQRCSLNHLPALQFCLKAEGGGYKRIISAASPAVKPSGQISRHQNHSASQFSVK